MLRRSPRSVRSLSITSTVCAFSVKRRDEHGTGDSGGPFLRVPDDPPRAPSMYFYAYRVTRPECPEPPGIAIYSAVSVSVPIAQWPTRHVRQVRWQSPPSLDR